MVAAAWNIDELARRYAEFIAEFSRLAPKSADDVFRAQTTLVHEWRRRCGGSGRASTTCLRAVGIMTTVTSGPTVH